MCFDLKWGHESSYTQGPQWAQLNLWVSGKFPNPKPILAYEILISEKKKKTKKIPHKKHTRQKLIRLNFVIDRNFLFT